MGPMQCTTVTLMSLFEHVSKHSLRFYHMARVWAPPCSALLNSVNTDAFQSDCLASFLSVCVSHYISGLSFHLTALCAPSISLFLCLSFNLDITLALPSARLLCDVISAASAFVFEMDEKKTLF